MPEANSSKSEEPTERKPSDILAEKRTEMALGRTVLAAGRNLLAWVRTSVSLISFGFTIYKFLQLLHEHGATPGIQPSAPRNIGLFLIGLGTFPLILILIDYWQVARKLGCRPKFILTAPSFILACAILALGLLLFTSIITRMEIL
jgi:putative membrane protein